VARVREATAQFRAEHTRKGSKTSLSEAERIAQDADAFQARQLPNWAAETEEEKRALEQNLRALAITLKRHDETDDDAYDRIKDSSYVTALKHDEYWPFYYVDFQLGKVILTINTAHPFFTLLYEPLGRIAAPQADGGTGADDGSTVLGPSTDASSLLIALQMLLFSLGRAQSQMLSGETASEYRLLFVEARFCSSRCSPSKRRFGFRYRAAQLDTFQADRLLYRLSLIMPTSSIGMAPQGMPWSTVSVRSRSHGHPRTPSRQLAVTGWPLVEFL